MAELSDLRSRANVEVLSATGKPLVLYEDHRTLVFVLWQALKEGVLSAPPLLVYFDAHDDAKQPTKEAVDEAKRLRSGQPDPREVLSFVEWSLSSQDDDWLLAAFELGVLADALAVGVESASNLQGFEFTHSDHTGETHRIWNIGHLWDAIGYQGSLSDTARESELGEMWRAIGWCPSNQSFTSQGLPPVVLDFDLDCFSFTLAEQTFAWPEQLIRRRFRQAVTSGTLEGLNAAGFLERLEEERVVFRTVARESGYCGGTLESQRILMSLDDALWDGELFSDQCR